MKGKCLCGAVAVSAPEGNEVGVCHCGMCRRWGGGPMFALHCGSDVQITGQDKLKTFQSSDWAARVFCGECGTHIYYHLLPADEYVVAAGLFQEDESFVLTDQIFIDTKPGYYSLANDTRTMTEAEVIAYYAPD